MTAGDAAPAPSKPPRSLRRYAWLSIAAALGTMALKSVAYLLTGSVGLLSDALESIVNLVAAIFALYAIKLTESPADEDHAYGHDKAEYFSSGLEGLLIFGAAASIAVSAILRLMSPRPLEALGYGIAVSAVASLINFGVARVLFSAGRKARSITLQADAHHLMTDVWTSIGVVVGVGLVKLSGWLWLDPVVALAMAAQIARTGGSLVYESGMGLLDRSAPESERKEIEAVLSRYMKDGVTWHALRTRIAGSRRFVTVHVLVPGDWTVSRGHDLLEQIERDIRHLAPKTNVLTHLEPVEDPRAHDDQELDRQSDPGGPIGG
jgi:cation diffusion facilitator family transporter